ncbi:MAG TPA: homoserine kinase, partial [Candidatus Methanomethylophilaceae archaeon]|nr:homoserine kinase [Candidatus Methanomethylophilaceae archaeon]
MSGEWIKVIAPATISNLGPGFDVFGMALQSPYDIIYARKAEKGVRVVSIEGPGAKDLPFD